MASKGINIPIASDTREFSAGIKKGVIEPLDNVEDALKDIDATGDRAAMALEGGLKDAGKAADKLGDEGQDAGEKLEKALKSATDETKDLSAGAKRSTDDLVDGFKDAQKATDKYEKAMRDAIDSTKSRSRDAGSDFGDNIKRGTKAGEDGLNDFKDEANSTAKEAAASFDGSADSIKDAFQEVAANAFVGFGPAGAVAGIAAAAGIGLVGAAFEANQENAEEMAQATNDAYDSMIEAGGKFLSTEVQNAAIQDVIKEKWKEIKEAADITGLSVGDVARGYALGGTELETVKDRLSEVYDANNKLITTGEGFTETLVDQNGKIGKQIEYLNGVNGVQAQALQMAQAYDQATGGAVKQRSDERDRIQDRNRALQNTPTTVSTRLVVDDSAITRALIAKTLKVTIDTVDRMGRKVG